VADALGCVKDEQKIEKLTLEMMSDRDFEVRIRRILSGEDPPPTSFEDSDQSPLAGNKAQFLRNQWSSSMDYSPVEPLFSHLSSWLKTVWCGDYEGMMTMLQNKDDDEVKKMLSKRESMLNVNAIFHVIIGARTMYTDLTNFKEMQTLARKVLNVKKDHVKVLSKLISLGAEVNVHDVAGYTPLHHCVTAFGNDITNQMAEILMKAGANVNAQNRFGATPLLDTVLVRKWDSISLLLSYGADHLISDFIGNSPNSLSKFSPKLQDMFGAKNKKNAKAERKKIKAEAGGSLRKCSVCDKGKSDTKRCTGCYLEWYCGPECQKIAWTEHREDCKKTRAEYKSARLIDRYVTGKNNLTGKIYRHCKGDRPCKSHFVVKVQLALEDVEHPLQVYNQEMSLYGSLEKEGNESVFTDLTRQIKNNGFMGAKGYFYALYDTKEKEKTKKSADEMRDNVVEIKINTAKILPVEIW